MENELGYELVLGRLMIRTKGKNVTWFDLNSVDSFKDYFDGVGSCCLITLGEQSNFETIVSMEKADEFMKRLKAISEEIDEKFEEGEEDSSEN